MLAVPGIAGNDNLQLMYGNFNHNFLKDLFFHNLRIDWPIPVSLIFTLPKHTIHPKQATTERNDSVKLDTNQFSCVLESLNLGSLFF